MGLSIVMHPKPAARDRAPSRHAAEVQKRRKLKKRVSPSQQPGQPDKLEEQVVELGLVDAMEDLQQLQDNPVVAAPPDGPPIVPALSQPKDVEALVIMVMKA